MNLRDVPCYARTAVHLRPDQLAHAVRRRIVPVSHARRASDAPRVRERARFVAAPPENRFDGSAARVDRARVGSASGSIDWTLRGGTRLQRYHLHYFDFLTDPARTRAWKLATIAQWRSANPPGTPDAWDAYPVSLRLVNWIKFFDREPDVDEDALRSAYAHALWLETNLERRVLANHLLKNAKALLFAGIFFAGDDAARWLRTGTTLLRAEVREQFLADGGHYERSPTYHAIAVMDALDVVNAWRSVADLAASADVAMLEDRAREGLAFFDGLLFPDGNIPLFNDAAFGVGPEPEDLFAYAAATIGWCRDRADVGFVLRSYPSSGYYVVRDGDDMLVVDCGEPGPAYQPGHGHADALSYELAIAGRRIVVDRGVCGYEAGEGRSFVRGTSAHNTIAVDGLDQCELWGAFRMGRRIRLAGASLRSEGARTARFTGAFAGFRGGRDAIVHRRSIDYASGTWTVTDRIEGRGVHRIDNRIHLAPGLRAAFEDERLVVRDEAERPIVQISLPDEFDVSLTDTPYFPHVGDERRGRSVVLSRTARLPVASTYAIARA